ncbi:2-hydroxymuconate semialdehyde hydrolase [Pigmentiphaga humi]|uniref:2-hydroxymuconate semialdehyde hydrolase n=1 Tax=Pigmentiphaga humi TaxID=2478468 RepID=A0A3P4BB28_9BURK|nr:alpha/beta hydrolase [Pigmentiphaga humi]VCU72325.1 2-hydroxymuconate semialdehyde hydrolase [Pigmentiphaga humi]
MNTTETSSSPELGKSLALPGLRVNYHDRGEGRPLLLVHGSGPGVSAWANWRGVIDELSCHHRVIAPDMAGFGYTAFDPGTSFDIDHWVGQVIGVLDALELEQVDLLGNSFGGGIALHVARRHPERVRRLVLMGAVSVSFPLTEGLDMVWGYTPSIDNMRRLMGVFAWDQSLTTESLVRLRYEASIQRGMDKVYESLFPAPRQRWVDMLAQPEEELARIDNPTLILHGRDDKVIPLEASLRLLRILKNADLTVFGNCGHWTQIEKRREFVHAVLEFLAAPAKEQA